MPAFVWIALAVFIVLFVAGALWSTVNTLRAWRRGWPVVHELTASIDELPPKLAVLERQITVLEPKLTELSRSTASLSRSLGRAKLMLDVVLEAKTVFGVARTLLRLAK